MRKIGTFQGFLQHSILLTELCYLLRTYRQLLNLFLNNVHCCLNIFRRVSVRVTQNLEELNRIHRSLLSLTGNRLQAFFDGSEGIIIGFYLSSIRCIYIIPRLSNRSLSAAKFGGSRCSVLHHSHSLLCSQLAITSILLSLQLLQCGVILEIAGICLFE